jgi:predicted amidohydrolase
LQDISRQAGLALAGNVVEPHQGGFLNKLLVFDGGTLVAEQAKLHPMPTEERWGIRPWPELVVAPWRDLRLGALVCADVLHPEAARILALRGAEVVLVPVMSYQKPRDETREARRAMFLARAYDNACFVLKAGSVARLAGGQLVGRSLIAAPWGMLAESKDELAEEVLVADLDLDRVREERKRSLSLGRRQPEAYGPLVARTQGVAEPHEAGFDIQS